MPRSALATDQQDTGAREVTRGTPEPAPVCAWTAEMLHDFIGDEIARHGPQLPCPESLAIAQGFRERFGAETAARIAMLAFDAHGGMWQGAPVTWRRFRASHDDFFGRPIQEAISG